MNTYDPSHFDALTFLFLYSCSHCHSSCNSLLLLSGSCTLRAVLGTVRLAMYQYQNTRIQHISRAVHHWVEEAAHHQLKQLLMVHMPRPTHIPKATQPPYLLRPAESPRYRSRAPECLSSGYLIEHLMMRPLWYFKWNKVLLMHKKNHFDPCCV